MYPKSPMKMKKEGAIAQSKYKDKSEKKLKKSQQITPLKKRLLLAVVLTAVAVILYKIVVQQKARTTLKILLFINSLMINDLSLRKYDGKISNISAFIILLCQKFMSIFIVKILLTGSFPSIIDSSFFLLFGLHLSSFFYFHSHHGKKFLGWIMKSDTRLVLQETFKGYGKGISLLSSIYKGFKLDTNPLYFIMVIVIRCLASSTFKVIFLSKILGKKKFKLKKTKVNFVFNAIPTIIAYFMICLVKMLLSRENGQGLEEGITFFFVCFMMFTRMIKSFWKILNLRKRKDKKKMKKELKKFKKQQKKVLKLKEQELATQQNLNEAPLVQLLTVKRVNQNIDDLTQGQNLSTISSDMIACKLESTSKCNFNSNSNDDGQSMMPTDAETTHNPNNEEVISQEDRSPLNMSSNDLHEKQDHQHLIKHRDSIQDLNDEIQINEAEELKDQQIQDMGPQKVTNNLSSQTITTSTQKNKKYKDLQKRIVTQKSEMVNYH
eukprot:403357098